MNNEKRNLRNTIRRYEDALNLSKTVIWEWNLDRKVIILPGKNTVFPFENECIEEDLFYEKIFQTDREYVKIEIERLKDNSNTEARLEYRMELPDEYSLEWVETHITTIKEETSNKIISLLGSTTIISERKNREQRMMAEKSYAKEEYRSKIAFLTSMGNEIRSPLNAVIGFSEILADSIDNKEMNEYVDQIKFNTALLLQIVEDILDLSKLEAGQLDFFFSDFDLTELMHEIEIKMKGIINDKKIELILTPTPSFPICSEKKRLSQVLTSLIKNACNNTDEGFIEFGYNLQQNGHIYFYVKDSGRGIEEQKQSSIFRKVSRYHQSAIPDSGLDLPICRLIVEKMGGEIGVESEVGKGSTFWFSIPYTPTK